VLRALPLQDPRAQSLLPNVDQQQKMASWHLITQNGRVHSGGKAVPHLLRLLPGGRPIAWLAGLLPGVVDRVYELISRNRSRLARYLHSSDRPTLTYAEFPLDESRLVLKEGPGQDHNESGPIPQALRLE
jgi:predicted DCC family thiol-disulfide oxidoreductase YuxK